MIAYQKETLFDVIEEVEALLQLHYEELTIGKNKVKLNPQWDKYVAVEQAGILKLFTARDDGKLIGYSAFFVTNHMHYSDLLAAINDILFLHKDYRKGLTGFKLIKFSHDELKVMGVDKITWGVKLSNDFRPLLHRLGYKDEDVTVTIIL